ncbi:hypothetical protein V8C86DRAFT_1270928 [Haematococcus lacustris]
MYVASAGILALHPAPSLRCQRCRYLALAMAAVATVEVYLRGDPEDTARLALAHKMLGSARAVAEESPAVLSTPGPSTHQLPSMLLYYELLVAVITHDTELQTRMLVQQLPALAPASRPSAQQLLEIADMTRDGHLANLDTCLRCYQLALQQLAASARPSKLLAHHMPPADTCSSDDSDVGETLAYVVRCLVELSNGDSAKLAVLQEAVAVMSQVALAGMPDDTATAPPENSVACGKRSAFPAKDVEWLVSTCWNQGAHHTRFQRRAEGARYMRTALDLLEFAPPDYDQLYRSMMTGQLAKVQAAAA